MLLYFLSEGLAKFFKINKPCTQRSICIFLLQDDKFGKKHLFLFKNWFAFPEKLKNKISRTFREVFRVCLRR